jgi:hypothetical protein
MEVSSSCVLLYSIHLQDSSGFRLYISCIISVALASPVCISTARSNVPHLVPICRVSTSLRYSKLVLRKQTKQTKQTKANRPRIFLHYQQNSISTGLSAQTRTRLVTAVIGRHIITKESHINLRPEPTEPCASASRFTYLDAALLNSPPTTLIPSPSFVVLFH